MGTKKVEKPQFYTLHFHHVLCRTPHGKNVFLSNRKIDLLRRHFLTIPI